MQLGYVIFYVPDVFQAVEFYERAFGLGRRFVQEDNSYGEMETGATTLAFVLEGLADSHGPVYRKTRPGEAPPSMEIALTTPDVDAAFMRAVEAGAQGVKSPQKMPWGQSVSYVQDLNGYLVEICSPMTPL